ncbi:hypothetical protein ABPG75_010371 [Micractinium tetrahymenae]
MAESFCEVCGDTGGAHSMMICENTDLGCLGGIHLYCCVPLRTEAPTEAWYCSQCSQVRQEAAKAKEAKRQARKRQRQEQQEQRRRQRLLEREQRRKLLQQQQKQKQQQEQQQQQQKEQQQEQQQQQQKEQQQEQQQQHGAVPSLAHPPDKTREAEEEGGRQRQAQQAGAAQSQAAQGAGASAASRVSAAAAAVARATAPAAPGAANAAPLPAIPCAPGNQLGSVQRRKPSGLAAAIAAMSSGRGATGGPAAARHPAGVAGTAGPQQVQQAQQAQQAAAPSAACKDTLALLFATLDRRDEASREQQRRVSSQVDGTSRLMQRSMSEREARQRALQRQLSLAACQGTRLHWRGRLQLPLQQDAAPWEASLLCYGLPRNPHSADAARWLVPLADAAAAGRQPPPQVMHMEDLGISQEQAYLGASLLLAPEPGQQAAQQQPWFALWQMLSSSNQAVTIPVPPGAAMAAAAAAARSSGGWQDGQLEGLFLALVPNRSDPEHQTFFGLLAVPHKAALPSKGAAPGRSILRRAQPAAAAPEPAAAAAGEQAAGSSATPAPLGRPVPGAAAAKAGVGWADGSSDDAPQAAAVAQLELQEGSHYATPARRAQQAARPARLPVIRSFEASQEGPLAAQQGPLPLEGLHIAIVGFTVSTGWMPDFLRELRGLGAVVYTSKVVLADVLVLHPGALQGGLEAHFAGTFPLGLAHLLATSPVRAYSDSSLQVLHDMRRLKRRLQGAEWQRPTLVFPGGLLVVLDAAALCSMPTAVLSEVLSHVQRLQAASPDPQWTWGAAAPPADIAALQAAAGQGHAPAAHNWELWRSSSVARQLTPGELSSSAGHDGVYPAVVHASKAARVHVPSCRLVYLCSSHEDTLRQAEGRVSILSGTPDDLLEFLRERKS